uniref:F-box domain-containing protein n=1 Tax=Caenorhabditis tropicalis TaxID=1561998 RepID=A0A1I7UML0_9PELO
MSSSPPFALFNLPYVPLSIILNTMNELQIMKVALTSKKVYKLSKMLRKRRTEKLELNVSICNYSAIEIVTEDIYETLFLVQELSEIQEDLRIEYLKIGDTVVQTQKPEDRGEIIYFYFEDHFIGIQILSEIVSDFFSVPIQFLDLREEVIDPRRVFNWIMSRQNSVADFKYECKEANEEDLKYFLDNCEITNELILGVPNGFQYSFKYPMNLERVVLIRSSWMTINNLFEINPRYLDMSETRFTNEDMNLFVRNWINGGHWNLRTLILLIEQLDFHIILNDIPFVWRETPDDFIYNLAYEEYDIRGTEPVIEIRNVNGVIGWIMLHNDVENSFTFYIWPDWEGKPYPLEPIVQ